MTDKVQVGIRHLTTEVHIIRGIQYTWQNMLCQCGSLFFIPSSTTPEEIRCQGCEMVLRVHQDRK